MTRAERLLALRRREWAWQDRQRGYGTRRTPTRHRLSRRREQVHVVGSQVSRRRRKRYPSRPAIELVIAGGLVTLMGVVLWVLNNSSP